MALSDIHRDLARDLLGAARQGRLTRRELLRRATVLGIPLAAVSGLLAACGGPPTKPTSPDSQGGSPAAGGSSGAPRRGGTLRVGVSTPTAAIDPVTMYDSASMATVEQSAEYLAWVANDLSLRPVLATKWSPEDGAKRWRFRLRDGVRFHDGSPLTPADVVATFERLVDPASSSAALTSFKGILSKGNIEAHGSSEVVFHLDRAFAEFPYLVASTNYNAVVLPRTYHGDFAHHPVGTGPYLLDAYTPKRMARFRRNPHYWRPALPYLDTVELHYLPDTQSQVLQMQGGTIDVVSLVTPQADQPLYHDDTIRILSTSSSMYREVHMRVDKHPFTDQRVRQALALCVDRAQVIQSLFSGAADLGDDHPFAPVFPDSPQLGQRKQDYRKAKQLLAAAGHGDGLKITISLEQAGEIPDYAVLLQQMFKPAGVTATLHQMSQQAYYGSGTSQPWLEVPMGIVDWGARAIPAQVYGPAYTCHGVWNASKWCTPDYDALAKTYEATVAAAERRTLATKMATLQQDATPAIIGYWIHSARATTAKVHGVEANGTGLVDLTTAFLTG